MALARHGAGNPGPVLDRLAFLRRRLALVARGSRQHGCPGCVGHDRGLAFQRCGYLLGSRAPECVLRSIGHRDHACAFGKNPRGARQGEDVGGYRSAGRVAAADRAHRTRRKAGRGAGGGADSWRRLRRSSWRSHACRRRSHGRNVVCQRSDADRRGHAGGQAR